MCLADRGGRGAGRGDARAVSAKVPCHAATLRRTSSSGRYRMSLPRRPCVVGPADHEPFMCALRIAAVVARASLNGLCKGFHRGSRSASRLRRLLVDDIRARLGVGAIANEDVVLMVLRLDPLRGAILEDNGSRRNRSGEWARGRLGRCGRQSDRARRTTTCGRSRRDEVEEA